MALGLKQLTPDPVKSLKIGSTVNGTISKIIDAGVFMKLESGAEGFIRASELIVTDRPMFGDRPDRSDRKERAVVPADIKVGDPIYGHRDEDRQTRPQNRFVHPQVREGARKRTSQEV